jgi:3'(2'), 5'-bisphosphate nucleotidase
MMPSSRATWPRRPAGSYSMCDARRRRRARKREAVIQGDADAYLHAGGQYEWDSAAPVAVAAAAGLHASRIDGSGLVYNRPDPKLPDLLVCRRELAEPILAAIRKAAG